LNLKGTCYWLLKSKRSHHRLLLPAPHSLLVAILSIRTLRLIKNINKVELVTATVPPTVTTRMMMMTTTTIKLVITMKVYNLLNDVSFLLPIMVPP
jgi:hypothetical protein